MVKIVIYALGTNGDIDPMVALAVELIRRGHSVIFLSSDYFESVITAAGCKFVSIGTLEQYHKGNSVSAWQATNHTDNFEYYHAPAFEPAFEFMKNLSSGKDSLLLALGDHGGAVAAAEKFDIPFVKIILSPNLIFSTCSPPAPLCWSIPQGMPKFFVPFLLRRNRKIKFMRFCKAPHTAHYMATRKRLQCPLKLQKQSKAIVQIGFFPEWYALRPSDWPTNLKLVGFPLQNRSSATTRKEFDVLVERLGAPLIFTTGTGVKDTIELFQEGRKICEQLQVPGIFVGGSQGVEVFHGSALCAHMSYVDFEYALSKALAIVHHGGIGTTAQAIKAGIPQLIRPLKYDQPDNANRIYKLGLGSYVMPERFKVEEVTPMLKSILQKAKSSKALSYYSQEVKCSHAIVEACDAIERVCSSFSSQ